MNLQKLFKIQAELDNRIVEKKGLQEQDLLDKKILALQVELGELANEWRGFKFWSNNQSPAIRASNPFEHGNPMLEEYVDCLHFILSIGLEIGHQNIELVRTFEKNITDAFLSIFERASDLDITRNEEQYTSLFSSFVDLGKMLGFTWEQIEQAYLDKNKVNHERQANGY